MGWAVLKLTDGTVANTINLLSTNSGYLLDDWRPAIQIPKSGGIWNGSPLTDGRRLALRNYENAIEVFNLKASKGTQDELIREIQNLFRLMDMAVNYWITGWQTTPVYIEAKATNETNTRYATIMDYRISGLNNPYAQPFFACPSIEDELTLTIEHDYWMEQPPGTDTAIQISAQQVYNGVTYGRSATTSDEVYIANKHVMANITHAFVWDDAGGFGGNLIGAAPPYPIFPLAATITDGDKLYLGCNTALANSGPFSGAVFDITTGAVGFTSVTWYYWNGAWVAIPDLSTNAATPTPFQAGSRYINFVPPSDWVTTAVNGITGYWIYGVIDVFGGATPPQQGNRDIYAPVVPFVDIDSAQVVGDVPALSKLILTNCYEYVTPAPGVDDDREVDIITAIRSIARGDTFTPYINLADEQNQTGITISTGTDVAIATYVPAPSGRAYRWQATTDAEAMRLRINFSAALLAKYTGRYVAFLRYYATDVGTTNIFLRLVIESSGGIGYLSTTTVYIGQAQTILGDEDEIDFGVITIPDIDTASFYIEIVGSDTASTNDIYFYDLILMPADEWLARSRGSWYGDEGIIREDYFILDSITKPKDFCTGNLMTASDYLKAPLSVSGAGQSVLQPNADQRLWTYFKNTYGKDAQGNYNAFHLQAWRMARYMAMRGSR